MATEPSTGPTLELDLPQKSVGFDEERKVNVDDPTHEQDCALVDSKQESDDSESFVGTVFHVERALGELQRWPEKKKGYSQLAFYLTFLSLYLTIQVMQLNPDSAFEVNRSLRGIVDGYQELETLDSLVTYLDDLIPAVFESEWYNGQAFTAEQTSYINYYNKLVGGLQVIQGRGKVVNCSAGLYTAFYGECHSDEVSHEPYGTGDLVFDYKEDQGGYEMFFSVALSLRESLKLWEDYKQARWLDKSTRAITIKFAVYNGEFEMFSFVALDFRFGQEGIMTGRNIATINSAKFELYKVPMDFVRLGLELVWLYLVAWTFTDEVLRCYEVSRTEGFGAYFGSVWTVLDLANLALVFAYIVNRVVYVTFIWDHPIVLPSNKYEKDLEIAANIQTTLLAINAFNIFEKIMHLFKFFQFQDRMRILNQTMAVAFKDLMHFFVLFFLIFLGYCSMAYLLFGSHLVSFSSFGRTVQMMGNLVLGDFDYEELFVVNPLMSSIMFWTFIFLVFFALVNVFLAIIVDSYAAAKSASKDEGEQGIDDDMAIVAKRLVAKASLMRSMRGKTIPHNLKHAFADPLQYALTYFHVKSVDKVAAKDVRWVFENMLDIDEKASQQLMDILEALPGKREDEAVEVQLEALLKDTWQRFDKDGSGELSREEFYEFMLNAPLKFREEDMDAIFEAADSSGDGTVEYSEFVTVFKKLILDPDKGF